MAGLSIRVLLADEYEPWCRFVASTLEKQPQFRLVGVVSDGLAVLREAQEQQADMILLDISLPKLNGLEVTREIRKQVPQTKIIIFSENCSFNIAEHAFRIDAEGYVVKSDAGKELVPALEAVLQGKQYVSARLGGRVPTGFHRAAV